MAGNEQKTHFRQTINQAAINRAADEVRRQGKSLPCSVVSVAGAIVTVKFEVTGAWTLPNVTIPLAGAEYVRLPIQPGCKGVARAADARLGGVTGLGTGAPDLADEPGNLTALVFEPVGNTAFPAVDGSTLVLYGEPNVLVQDKTGAAKGLFTSNGITLSFGGHTLTLDASGFSIDGGSYANHEHIDGGGTGNSGPVAAGT